MKLSFSKTIFKFFVPTLAPHVGGKSVACVEDVIEERLDRCSLVEGRASCTPMRDVMRENI